jgi:hypothetical protein
LVYVDDLIIGGNSEINALKHLLDYKFRIKDLGNLCYFLGLEIAPSKQGIFLNQRKYHKAAPGHGLLYKTTSSIHLRAYRDADWATYPVSRRSITSNCVFLGDFLISWKYKKQSTVSRSSSEAEYSALASIVYEVQWLTYLLKDLHQNFKNPALVFSDNDSARYIAQNYVFHKRTKHIEIDCHVVRERLQ